MYKISQLQKGTRIIPVHRFMSTPVPPNPAPNPRDSLSNRYRPTKIEKLILVWTKKFKTQDEIPNFVSADLLEKSRSQARIKLANIFMLLTALASFGAILSGKAAAKRGESVHQMNLDFHKKYEDEYNKTHGSAPK